MEYKVQSQAAFPGVIQLSLYEMSLMRLVSPKGLCLNFFSNEIARTCYHVCFYIDSENQTQILLLVW